MLQGKLALYTKQFYIHIVIKKTILQQYYKKQVFKGVFSGLLKLNTFKVN